MKKTTIFFLVVGVLAIGVGGIGSAVFYQKAKTSMVQSMHEKYTIKNKQKIKEVHLNLSGNANYVINSSTDDTIAMNARSSVTAPINGSLEAKETDDTLTVTVNGKQKNDTFEHFDFQFFHLENSQIELTVPEDIDRLIIDGEASGTIKVNGLITKEFTTDLKHADFSANYNTSEKMTLTSKSGLVELHGENKIEELTVKGEHNDTYISNLTSNSINIVTSGGDISLTDIRSNSIKAESRNGEIYLHNAKGEVELSGNSGSIYVTGENLPKKLKAMMEHGDIEIDLYQEQDFDNMVINAESNLGDVEIFGEERNNFSKGKNGTQFDLKTNTGDIAVYGYFTYEEEDED